MQVRKGAEDGWFREGKLEGLSSITSHLPAQEKAGARGVCLVGLEVLEQKAGHTRLSHSTHQNVREPDLGRHFRGLTGSPR